MSSLDTSVTRCDWVFSSSLTAMSGCSVAKRRSALLCALDALARLAHLLAEELLRGHVGGAARLVVGLDVRLRVGRGEEGRQGGLGVVKLTSMRSVPRTSFTVSHRM